MCTASFKSALTLKLPLQISYCSLKNMNNLGRLLKYWNWKSSYLLLDYIQIEFQKEYGGSSLMCVIIWRKKMRGNMVSIRWSHLQCTMHLLDCPGLIIKRLLMFPWNHSLFSEHASSIYLFKDIAFILKSVDFFSRWDFHKPIFYLIWLCGRIIPEFSIDFSPHKNDKDLLTSPFEKKVKKIVICTGIVFGA